MKNIYKKVFIILNIILIITIPVSDYFIVFFENTNFIYSQKIVGFYFLYTIIHTTLCFVIGFLGLAKSNYKDKSLWIIFILFMSFSCFVVYGNFVMDITYSYYKNI